ncbi:MULTISPECIES: rhamnosyltransferase [unclassified Brenneria]|uniref:rhamnosyltransferase n=1 Tax=unclassified Brenneria TaxID=2634434 RepID=UPI0018F090D3|nr:rhamnosyltransferase [Brenneria sp. L3-3C-1]MBJ7221594.1 rhamnosyltransferase [Brenneria sp. L3-3C-1]MEE3642836.1 rhamnosyltransferase [Brenneria sp. L3_3C_1]
MTYTVVAILVTYNPVLTELQESLHSIKKQVDKIIIIDNASSNSTALSELVKKNLDSAELILSPLNIGLSAAQNLGIDYAYQHEATHIILFDQDSLIEDDFIKSLLTAEDLLISQGQKVAAVGPAFFDAVSHEPYPATVYIGPFIKKIPTKNITEATFIIASGCLISMKVIDKVGKMKDELFIDYIDIEWSLRAKNLGYKVFIVPDAKMAHSIGDRRMSIMGRNVSVHSPLRRYYLIRNSFYLMRLNYVPIGYKLREAVFNLLRFVVSIISSGQKKEYIKYGFWGLRDGLKGKFGPLERK